MKGRQRGKEEGRRRGAWSERTITKTILESGVPSLTYVEQENSLQETALPHSLQTSREVWAAAGMPLI